MAEVIRELPHFNIEGYVGGNQDWFIDPMMKLGGCGAETACDISIYLDLYKGTALYPYDIKKLNKKDYISFSKVMKPYLSPRMSGIDRLDIYTEGFGKFLADRECECIGMEEISGDEKASEVISKIISQIDDRMPVATLTLRHHDKKFKEFFWHWYLINGYKHDGRKADDPNFEVKCLTYGESEFINFRELWDTGYEKKGGIVLFRMNREK